MPQPCPQMAPHDFFLLLNSWIIFPQIQEASLFLAYMGGGISGLQGSKLDDSKSSAGRLLLLNIDELPESCVALILSYLDPPQICRLACLNTTFRQASLSDFVWESKLPPNYKILANKLFFNDQNSEMITLLSKKEIFHRFCCSNHFDSNTKVGLLVSKTLCFIVH